MIIILDLTVIKLLFFVGSGSIFRCCLDPDSDLHKLNTYQKTGCRLYDFVCKICIIFNKKIVDYLAKITYTVNVLTNKIKCV